MRGTVKTGERDTGIIVGADEYFFHVSDMENFKKCAAGIRVSFKVTDGHGHLKRAVKINKKGNGTRHPLLQKIKQLDEAVDKYVTDETMKGYLKRDLGVMRLYFLNIDDYEQFKNPVNDFYMRYQNDRHKRNQR